MNASSILQADIDESFHGLLAKGPRVGSLAEFDAEVAKIREKWREPGRSPPRTWFRGHSDASWHLTPSVLREPFDELGHQTQHAMFVEFRRRALGIIDHEPRTTWGWIYLAQHHGLPTSLLDWSESSHIALFFALERRAGAPVHREHDACVWLLNPGELNQLGWGFSNVVAVTEGDAHELLNPALHGKVAERADGKPIEPLGLIPEYVTERLRAQRGAFVAFGWEREGLMRQIARAPDRLAAAIVIPAINAAQLEADLDVAGVAESTVFPDLDGLSAELARRHDHDR